MSLSFPEMRNQEECANVMFLQFCVSSMVKGDLSVKPVHSAFYTSKHHSSLGNLKTLVYLC